MEGTVACCVQTSLTELAIWAFALATGALILARSALVAWFAPEPERALARVGQFSGASVHTVALVKKFPSFALGTKMPSLIVLAVEAVAWVHALAALVCDRVFSFHAGKRCLATPSVVSWPARHRTTGTFGLLDAAAIVEVLCRLASQTRCSSHWAVFHQASKAVRNTTPAFHFGGSFG